MPSDHLYIKGLENVIGQGPELTLIALRGLLAGYRVLIGTRLPISFVHSECQNMLAIIRDWYTIPRYNLRLRFFNVVKCNLT